jgi:hypothetical protein
MWKWAVLLFALCVAPACGQRFEVYGMGGYLRLDSESGSTGAMAGGGFGVRAVSILGFQGEFFQARAHRPSGPDWTFNIGQVNLKLEPRSGRFRPYFILGGGGGGYLYRGSPDSLSNGARAETRTGTASLQLGGGVAIQLTDRMYIRPQVRVHAFGLQGAWSVPIALGYRF